MSTHKKLLSKLNQGTLSAQELRRLLKLERWDLKNTVGSHEHWKKENTLYTLATHTKELKRYMIKQAQKVILGDKNESK